MYKIDKGRTPPKHEDLDRFPFKALNVGDSFLVPDFREINCARTQMYHWNKNRTGLVFRSVKEPGGVRFFRVK